MPAGAFPAPDIEGIGEATTPCPNDITLEEKRADTVRTYKEGEGI